jgi:large subunit ribosomal protein L14e
MIEIGRLCLKTAGRDAGCKCVVVDILDERYVLIDGETRRRKCNILHLEPLSKVLKIEKGASHEVVKSEFKKMGLEARETKPKEKKERPRKIRKKKKEKTAGEKKEEKSKKKAKAEPKKKAENAKDSGAAEKEESGNKR